MAENIQTTLQTRQQSHGDFRYVSAMSQNLKRTLKSSRSFEDLEQWQQEALEAICLKLARIMSGNSFDPDHWHDISGYASLVVREIERREVEYQLEQGVRKAAEEAARQPTNMEALIREMPDEPRE